MPLIQDNNLAIALLLLAVILVPVLYRLNCHPLRHVPGPLLARFSSLFLHTVCYLGIESRVLRFYHEKYKTKSAPGCAQLRLHLRLHLRQRGHPRHLHHKRRVSDRCPIHEFESRAGLSSSLREDTGRASIVALCLEKDDVTTSWA